MIKPYYEHNGITIYHGDCLEIMPQLEDGSIDLILTDLPYGTMKGIEKSNHYGRSENSKHEWDTAIPHKAMLTQCNRLLRNNGRLILFSQDPYTAALTTEAHNNVPFCYRLIWLKDTFAVALSVNKAPVNYTEDICVFSKTHRKDDFGGLHPLRHYASAVSAFIGKKPREIFTDMGHQGISHFLSFRTTQFSMCTEKTYQEMITMYKIDCMMGFRQFSDLKKEDNSYRSDLIKKMTIDSPKVFNLPEGHKYKSNVLKYKKDYSGLHPTQKPVALIKDLIRTYTDKYATVLDFTMGSGTTLIAGRDETRTTIGIEMKENYCETAVNRLRQEVFAFS